MNYVYYLQLARERYAQELASKQGPPGVRWDEYERHLLEQIRLLDELLRETQDGYVDNTTWKISQAATS